MKILELTEKKFAIHMRDREYPACFESKKKYQAWQAAEEESNTKPRGLPCRDCTKSHYDKMSAVCPMQDTPEVVRVFSE